jgi:undecaprenyl-diphosphatase
LSFIAPPVTPLDARLFLDVYDAGNGVFTGVATALSAIGNGWSMLGLLPLYGVPRWRRGALFLTGALGASASLVFGLKAAFGRTRPCASLQGVHALCVMPTDPSFPSGHACGSFTVASFAVFLLATADEPRPGGATRAALGAGLVALAGSIAWSRVYLGVHFPGDVAAGALLGTASGALAAWLYRRPRLRRACPVARV